MDAAPTAPPPLDSWQPWFDRHHAALLLLARQFLPPPDAEDAVQNGFIKFWNARHKARDPVAFLFTCVRSAALDLRRAALARRRRESVAPPALLLLQSPAEKDERRRMIEAALQRLPLDQREILILKIWSDLTFAQIASALGLSPNTAASRYRYALEKLQSLLPAEARHD